jgi:hypothetical protein
MKENCKLMAHRVLNILDEAEAAPTAEAAQQFGCCRATFGTAGSA